MKISRRGNRIQKKLTFVKKFTYEENSVRSANIERARAYLLKMRPVYQLALKKWAHLSDDSKKMKGVENGNI